MHCVDFLMVLFCNMTILYIHNQVNYIWLNPNKGMHLLNFFFKLAQYI